MKKVCVSCHKLPKFCQCPPDAVATCPICSKPEAEGKHFPEVDCNGALDRRRVMLSFEE